MLGHGGNKMIPVFRTVPAGKAQDRKIAGLRSPRREDDLMRPGPDKRRDPVARLVKNRPRAATGCVDGGGIPGRPLHHGHHGLTGLPAERGGGIVVKVDHGRAGVAPTTSTPRGETPSSRIGPLPKGGLEDRIVAP